jgi:signal transduction histidine kinase
VLVLHSYERDLSPHNLFTQLFLPELSRASTEPVDFIELSLQPVRVSHSEPDESMLPLLQSMLAGRPPDLVVSIGGPAAVFAQRHRLQLFPAAPMLLAGVDKRFVEAGIGANDTAVAVDHEPTRLIDNILTVLPRTKHIFVVVGASHLERVWVQEMKRTFQRFDGRVTFSWGSELSFEEMLTRSASLPEHSAILYAILALDAKGVPHVDSETLARLHDAASAPIFGLGSTQLGRGIVGGPLLSTEELSHHTTAVAMRLLRGEAPRTISTPTQSLAAPAFDWRELRRWGIDDSRLPKDSAVRFQEPTTWQQYKRPIVAFGAVAGLQTTLMIALVANLKRRRRAEQQQRQSESTTHIAELELAKAALSGLSQRLMQLQEQERAWVAKELQDELCQRMTALTMRLHSLSETPEGDEHEMRRRVEELTGQFSDLQGDIIAISDQLYSPNLDVLGLATATRNFCKELSAQHTVTISFRDEHVPAGLPSDVALALFRVLQEAVRNAIKHANVHTVNVSLIGSDDAIQLDVADGGLGFDPEVVMRTNGLGLIGMRERVSLVNGTCSIESQPGGGTRMRARVPLS